MKTMTKLETMKWLIRREFWEHKGMIFWAPVWVGLTLIALLASVILYKGGNIDQQVIQAVSDPNMRAEIGRVMANSFMSTAMPLFVMLSVIVFFYCLGSLFEERRDRSILFWKSLPVSDQMTVFSKVALALIVAPAITIAVGIITSLVLLLMACLAAAFHGVNLFGPVLASGEVFLTPIRLLAMWPVYILWAIPTVGWLMLVSAWAKSKVFLWAVGLPILGMIIVKMADSMLKLNLDLGWFTQNVVARILGGLFPGAWLASSAISKEALVDSGMRSFDISAMLSISWMSLADAGVWIGAAAGLAMLFAAAHLRRWRDEA
jgi:ABC-2 type transport system permease protein